MDGINSANSEYMRNTIEFMDSIADLHLGRNSMSEWLQRLAAFARCRSACAISWTAGSPHTAEFIYSHEPITFEAGWIESVEKLLAYANPSEPALLDVIAGQSGMSGQIAGLDDNELMIAFLDSTPARTLLILRSEYRPGGWNQEDRERFTLILPVLLKAHLLHKSRIGTQNMLDIANKVLNATPRGIILLTPDCHVTKANAMAVKMINNQDGMHLTESGYFSITDKKVDDQLKAKIAEMSAVPKQELAAQIWNRSFKRVNATGSYQITLRMLPIDDWHLESNTFDRRAVIYVSSPETAVPPKMKQLQDFYDLTRGQVRVIESLMDGHDIVTTAARLHISVNTVRSHLRAIYAKLGVSSIAGLLRMISATLVDYSPDLE